MLVARTSRSWNYSHALVPVALFIKRQSWPRSPTVAWLGPSCYRLVIEAVDTCAEGQIQILKSLVLTTLLKGCETYKKHRGKLIHLVLSVFAESWVIACTTLSDGRLLHETEYRPIAYIIH